MKCNARKICKDYMCINARDCLHTDLKTPRIREFKPIVSMKYGQKAMQLIKKGHAPICRCCLTETRLTFDHIIPLSKGGADNNDNGQILCQKCNGLKGNKIISIRELINLRNKTLTYN